MRDLMHDCSLDLVAHSGFPNLVKLHWVMKPPWLFEHFYFLTQAP